MKNILTLSKCNNNCTSSIYEPYSKFHTPLSIERAKKYGVMLVDGNKFPTYAYRKAGGPIYVENSISGSSKIDREYFIPQETITDDTLDTSILNLFNKFINSAHSSACDIVGFFTSISINNPISLTISNDIL